MGYTIIDGWRERVLIDSGAQSNAMVPVYVKQHKMKVRPVHDLTMHPTLIPISGIGGHMAALRYIIINVQVEGIPSYYEEQVALVILNMTQLGMKVPVILETPMIHQLCRQMKESENTSEHVIELLPEQDEPFKERFRRIAPHKVEEVWQHIQEMLDRGAIQPSQSPWCNAVVLV